MCAHSNTTNQAFASFCEQLKQQLSASPLLDPPLAAALELLTLRGTWFECEVTHMAFNTEDMHLALGAGVLLSLWNGARLRS
jgi:hypothetical protein